MSIDWEAGQTHPNQFELALRYATRARIRQDLGLLKEAEDDIARSIAWGEAQSPREERILAICYATRAGIRWAGELLKEAEEDIAKSMSWEAAQTQPNHRELAIRYATRARHPPGLGAPRRRPRTTSPSPLPGARPSPHAMNEASRFCTPRGLGFCGIGPSLRGKPGNAEDGRRTSTRPRPISPPP